MSSNFFKSSSVIQEKKVRIINSNDIVAKQLEKISDFVKNDASEAFRDSFAEGISAREVAVLLEDVPAAGDVQAGTLTDSGERITDVKMQSQMASDLLQQANEDAREIREKALREAEEIKMEAFDKARTEGYAAGVAQAEAEIATQKKEIETLRKELEEEYRLKVEEMEPHLVDVITGVYEHVFKVNLSEQSEIVIHLINSTLLKLEGVRTFLLHVSKEDYPYISMQKKTLISGTAISPENVEIIEDFTMTKGQCLIETDGGIFDCGFGTHLERLKKELVLLSYEH